MAVAQGACSRRFRRGFCSGRATGDRWLGGSGKAQAGNTCPYDTRTSGPPGLGSLAVQPHPAVRAIRHPALRHPSRTFLHARDEHTIESPHRRLRSRIWAAPPPLRRLRQPWVTLATPPAQTQCARPRA